MIGGCRAALTVELTVIGAGSCASSTREQAQDSAPVTTETQAAEPQPSTASSTSALQAVPESGHDGGGNTQNSRPSGSAITTQLTSPWPTSVLLAPSETRRSTSAC